MCSQSRTPRFEDLEEKGFLVIPSFLSSDDMEFLLSDYQAKAKEVANNTNYSVVDVSEAAISKTKNKMAAIVSKVQEFTDISVDTSCVHIGYYFASEKVSFGWHQDHESYYALQNHYNYLNFFMPIHKPLKEKGNLSVVPWDSLKEQSEEAHKTLVGSGASITHTIDGRTLFTQEECLAAEIPADIDVISQTPELEAGDLLLLRGDIFHQTQDTDTDRIALSIRFANPNAQISRQKLLIGGKRKTNQMINNWTDFGPMVKAFQASGRKSMTWRELQEAMSRENFTERKKPRNKVLQAKLWVQRLFTGSFYPSIKCLIESRRATKEINRLRLEQEQHS